MAELWRYPVKSMRGERVDELTVWARGIVGDREYAVCSSGAPVGKPRLTSRERAALLRYDAQVVNGLVQVRTPEGGLFPVDDPALRLHLEAHLPQGHRITLEHDPAEAPYTDVRPVALASLETFAALGESFGTAVDPRRFRSNVVLSIPDRDEGGAAFPEDALSSRIVRVGDECVLRVLERIPRCRVVTLDPDTTEPDPALMKHLDRRSGGRLGVYAAVVTPGLLRVGDAVVAAD